MQDSSLEIIPTKAMLLKKNIAVKAVNEYKAVIFETHKSKKSKGAQGNLHKKASMAEKRNEAPALDMKRVRHEVLNFGISGHDFQNQQKANMALAIRLGAKPQKNIYKNYKELQAENKTAKAKAKEILHLRTVGKNSVGQATVSCNKFVNRFIKKSKRNNSVGELTTHYGIVNPKIQKKNRK